MGGSESGGCVRPGSSDDHAEAVLRARGINTFPSKRLPQRGWFAFESIPQQASHQGLQTRATHSRGSSRLSFESSGGPLSPPLLHQSTDLFRPVVLNASPANHAHAGLLIPSLAESARWLRSLVLAARDERPACLPKHATQGGRAGPAVGCKETERSVRERAALATRSCHRARTLRS